MNVDTAAAFPCDGAADRVDDAQHSSAFALDLLHRGERVEGFTGLTDGDVERVLLNHRVAVTKLGGRFSMRWDARKLLDQLRTEAPRDVRRAAPENLDAAHL